MSIGSLLKDRVTLVKKDGTVAAQNVAASVQSKKIFINDTKLAIELGDHILRSLPSGLDEDFIVTDASYHEGGSLSHWEICYCRSGVALAPKQSIINNIVNNVTGDNARVNLYSTDNSVNQSGAVSDDTFNQLIAVIKAQIEQAKVRDQLVELVEDMRQGSKSGSFKEKYQKFITAAAEHITIIAPFIPALTQLL